MTDSKDPPKDPPSTTTNTTKDTSIPPKPKSQSKPQPPSPSQSQSQSQSQQSPPILGETGKFKVKTSVYADIALFVGILSIIFLYAITNTPVIPDVDAPLVKKKRSKSGKIMQVVPPKPIDYTFNKGCGLVLSSTSIPNQGWGIFAIRNFTQGEVLVRFVMLYVVLCYITLRFDLCCVCVLWFICVINQFHYFLECFHFYITFILKKRVIFS